MSDANSSTKTMSEQEVEIIAVKEECCGTDTCRHTAIQHNDHIGWIVDGKLRCRTHESEPLFECSLNLDRNLRCELVVATDGHTHGPTCGHEMVPHGSHHDYLVGSRLHHVVENPTTCCERGCLGEVLKSTVVDHGYVHVKRRHDAKFEQETQEDDDAEAPLISKNAVTEIYAAGICCPSEVPIIKKILKKLPGVKSIDVAVISKSVRVEHNPQQTSPAVLLSALNSAGLQASIGKRDVVAGGKVTKLPMHVILSGFFLAVSICGFISSSVEWLKYFALVGVVLGSPLIFIRAVAAVRQLLLDINVLTLIACVGAIGLHEYHEAAAIVFLFGLSQWMEDQSMGKARRALSGLEELQPEYAYLATSGERIPVEKIAVKDQLIVRPGDRVPVDGFVITGSSALDESLLTGELKPVAKTEGDKLLSGSVNCGSGSLKMETTSNVNDSTVAQIAKRVDEAIQKRSGTQRAVEAFAKVYTPLIVSTATIVTLLPLVVESLDWEEWFKTALVLLVTACPCALVISTPVTTVCGITRATRKSVLIKGGNALEALSRLKVITFDKTGTLTEGQFNVVEIRALGNMTADDMLQWAASIEMHSSHPLAAAIVGYAAAKRFNSDGEAVDVQEIAGNGLIGMRNGLSVSVGSWSLMEQECDVSEDYSAPMKALEKETGERGHKAVFVGVDKKLVGVIIVADRIRHNAKRAISSLRSLGLRLGMLTGDPSVAAFYVAESVGIASRLVHSGLMPGEKANTLERYRRLHGAVGHVGDGVNDSPALASADVGIAMGVGGSTMAVEAADVALFSNDINSIATAIRISQRVRTVIYQNIVFSITVKLAVIFLAFLQNVRLWHAVIADIGSAIIVIMNGLRLLAFEKSKHEEQISEKEACTTKRYLMDFGFADSLEKVCSSHCCSKEHASSTELTSTCCSKSVCCSNNTKTAQAISTHNLLSPAPCCGKNATTAQKDCHSTSSSCCTKGTAQTTNDNPQQCQQSSSCCSHKASKEMELCKKDCPNTSSQPPSSCCHKQQTSNTVCDLASCYDKKQAHNQSTDKAFCSKTTETNTESCCSTKHAFKETDPCCSRKVTEH